MKRMPTLALFIALVGCGRGPAPCYPAASDAQRSGERTCEVKR